jgi:hypothetical protein
MPFTKTNEIASLSFPQPNEKNPASLSSPQLQPKGTFQSETIPDTIAYGYSAILPPSEAIDALRTPTKPPEIEPQRIPNVKTPARVRCAP